MKEVTTLDVKKTHGINVNHKVFFTVSLGYLLIPVLVFLLGWLRPYIGIPVTLIFCVLFYLFCKDCRLDSHKQRIDNDTTELSVGFLIAIAVAALAVTLVSDIGEYIWGTTDHAFRRAIFRDLVEYRWPVIYDLASQSNPVVNSFLPDVKVGFAYYFTFWMVPAVSGKVFGFAAANIVLFIWAAAGIFLTLLGMALFLKKGSFAVIFTYIFFSGLDIIPYLYFQSRGTAEWMWLEGYTEHIVYISNFNDLANVFNQCIPCWLIVILLMLAANNRSIGFIGAMAFAYSPWATIGMVPLAVYFLLRRSMLTNNRSENMRNIFSVLNILPAVLMIATLAPMYMANSNATGVSGTTLSFYGSVSAFVAGYLFAVIVELVPAALLLWGDNRKNPLFWVTMGVLLIMPFYKISGQNDFTMRGSMPEFFVLTVLLAKTISDFAEKNREVKTKSTADSLKSVGAFLLLVTMSLVALQMLLVIVSNTVDTTAARPDDAIYSLGDINEEKYLHLIHEQFYVYDYEDTFFYRYMARRA